MKKIFAIFFSFAVLSGCTANEDIKETVSSVTTTSAASETSEETKASISAEETTVLVTDKAEPDVYSDNVKTWAKTFAELVYEELENNKTAERPTTFRPVSCDREIPGTGFELGTFESDIFFIDTDFDGVPELFTGGHGITGSGCYTVYTADGGSYGSGTFAHYFDAYCIADGCMFANSGSVTFGGWTKLCNNLPTLFCNGFLSDEKPNNMTLTYADGRNQDFNGLTYDEVMDLYREYLGVEYDKLKFTGEDADIPFVYARGLLEVPDTENYTKEDICDCLAKLLAEYEKSAAVAPDDNSGVNPDGTLNEFFTEKIEKLLKPHIQTAIGSVYPALWDFDEDGIPEIILIFHSGGQGSMPCKVYSAETLEEIGEFDGFCRDGFTRFVNGYDVGTVIYSYYEHSDWQRVETAEFVHKEGEKLVSDKKLIRSRQTDGDMINPAMVVYSDNSGEASYREKEFLDWKFGAVCTSYGLDINRSEYAAAAVESYNNYIRVYNIAKEEYPVGCTFIGKKNEAAVYEIKGKGYFSDENSAVTPLNNDLPYTNIYKLNEDIIVCQPFGNTMPCDVYIMTDGKPALDKKISAHGMLLSRSSLYNGGFEMIESVYDSSTYGAHTFKKYQFYRDEDGFHEYGSITVPIEDFNKYYGESAQVFVDDIADIAREWENFNTDQKEIYEVFYRSDDSFILNCRIPLITEDTGVGVGYDFYNITLKPTADGKLTEVYRDDGVYKTALIPEIAVYPEEMYIPDTEN